VPITATSSAIAAISGAIVKDGNWNSVVRDDAPSSWTNFMVPANHKCMTADATAVLFLAGDVMTGRGVDQILQHPSGRQLFEPYVQDARQYVDMAETRSGPIPRSVPGTYIWGDALELLDRLQPDVRIVNLETAVTASDAAWKGKPVTYRMHPENVDCLTAARLDSCGLANNHVLDYGYAGLEETLDTLHRAGLKTAGAGRSLSEARTPVILPLARAGSRVLVFAVGSESAGVPEQWAARDDRSGVDFLPDLTNATADRLLDRIKKVRVRTDAVVVSIHWGTNWGYDIPQDQVRFAHRLIDGGVDLIHGHSSHHPRPVEVYKGRLILYGCGDLINDYEGISGEEQYRGDLAVMYFVTLATPTCTLSALQMIPMQIRRMRLSAAADADKEWVRTTLDRVSQSFGSHVDLAADGMLTLRWAGQQRRYPES
jgi:poly-gamma-glutamate synthesis protein (capsule biosynthesis protein)